jgi:hypothetical protein
MRRRDGGRREKKQEEQSLQTKRMTHQKHEEENGQKSPLDESIQVENEHDQEHAATYTTRNPRAWANVVEIP